MLFTFFIWMSKNSAKADNAYEHINPGIRMGDRSVMLNAAKHLAAHRARPFAAAQGDSEGPIPSSGLFFEPA